MEEEFNTLAKKYRTKLEEIDYYEEKRNYYKNAKIDEGYLKFVNKIRNFLKNVILKDPGFEIVYLNDLELPEEGYIIATNHKGFNDIPAMIKISEDPAHILLATDVPMNFATKIQFKLIGAIKIDRSNREDKQKALERLSIISAKGNCTVIYPEAVNNFTDSIPMFTFWPGVIEAAKNTGKPVVPVVTYDIEDKMYVKFGKPFNVNDWDNREEAANNLRDVMVTMLWEMLPETTRKEAIEAYEEPNLTRGGMTYKFDYEKQFIYRPVNPFSPTNERQVNHDEAFANLNHQISYIELINDFKAGNVKKIQFLQPRNQKNTFYVSGWIKNYTDTETFRVNTPISNDNLEEIIKIAYSVKTQVVCYPCNEPFTKPNNESEFSEMSHDDYQEFDIEKARNELKEKLNKQKEIYQSHQDSNNYEGELRLIKRKSK